MMEGTETVAPQLGPTGASTPGSEPGLALIEQSLGRALGQEQRAEIASALSEIADAWGRHRLAVPDGTEPDFVFRPIPPLSHGG